MQGIGNRSWRAGVTLALAVVIAGCAASGGPAPVEDRGTTSRVSVAPGAPATGVPPITVDASGKPGYYAVRPGDTLRRIGTETGQSWQNIQRWNNIDNPDRIEVGQVLRVIPPSATADASGAVTRPVVPPAAIAPAMPAAPAASAAASAATTPKPAAPAVAASGGDEDVGWIWPVHGPLIAGFDESKNKGLDIGGKAGDPVLAAADGRVVYSGAGLRGYGNLIILKHNNTYLTAYAHNQTLLVKEDQSVQKGQKIAEMGSSDADRVKLHFEIRRLGKPVDPARYLPAK